MKLVFRLTACALLMMLFFGCKKFIRHHDKSQCKIQKIVAYETGGGNSIEANFLYTSWGAPMAIKVSEASTGNPNHYFQYDQSKRLVGYIAGFPYNNGEDTSFHVYKKFVYEGDKIVSDTVFVESSTSEIDRSGYYVGKYYYDHFKRVIKYESVSYPDGSVSTEEYTYPNEDPYKDNRTLAGTHSVFMFVSRDYNTELPALEYNAAGYPTKFAEPNSLNSYIFLSYLNVQTVAYDCGGGTKKFY